MQNWKLNLELQQFIDINVSLPFFRDLNSSEKTTSYLELKEHILKEQYQKSLKPTIIQISKNITFNEIVKLLGLLMAENQVILSSSQAGLEKTLELEALSEKIKKQNQTHDLGPGIFLSTTGSSSKPKIYFFELKKILTTAHWQSVALGIQAHDKISCSLPFYHVSGLMTLFRAIISGGSLVLHQLNEESSFLNIDHISLVPTQILRLQTKKNALSSLANLKSVTIGGAVVSEELKKSLTDAKINFFESYGSTETLGFAILNHNLLPHLQLQLSDLGSPHFFGETLPDFYYQNLNLHLTQHHSLGLNLNDQLKKTIVIKNNQEVIQYHFIKRIDLIFQSAAENISPLEIEELLQKHWNHLTHHDFQFSFMVSKYPDPEYLWVPTLTIISSKEITEIAKKEMQNQCFDIFQKQLLPLKRPRYIDFQVIPKFFEEKISRNEIEKQSKLNLLEKLFDCSIQIMDSRHKTLVFHGFMGDKSDFYFLNKETHLDSIFLCTTLPWHKHCEENHFFFRNTQCILAQTKLLIQTTAELSESFSLLGYSMGGRLILQALIDLVSEFPQVIRKIHNLALISVGFGLLNDEERESRIQSDRHLFDKINTVSDLKEFYQKWYEQEIFGGLKRKSIIEDDYQNKAEVNFSLMASYKNALALYGQPAFPFEANTTKLFIERLLKVPTLLITGENDIKYTKLAERITLQYHEKQKSNNLNHYKIKNAYHDPQRTHPIEIIKILSKLRLDS